MLVCCWTYPRPDDNIRENNWSYNRDIYIHIFMCIFDWRTMNMMGTPGQCQMDRGLWKRRAQQDPWISTGSLPAPMNWKRPHEGKKVCWKWSKQKINITYYIIVYDLFDLYFVCTKNSINTLLGKKSKYVSRVNIRKCSYFHMFFSNIGPTCQAELKVARPLLKHSL